MDAPPGSTAAELSRALAAGTVTSQEVVDASLMRIARFDSLFSAVRALAPDATLAARESDQRRREEAVRGPLDGVPVLVKDNIDVAGSPCTAGALGLADRTPETDAPLVRRLREAGAIILGKVNLTELANFMTIGMPSGYSSLGGQVLNPYDLALTSSGSSSGSGAAVALGYAPVAIGTETDGSVTSPSLHQSLVGFKPTVGLISGEGIVPIAPSQDTAGPMARTVADAASLLAVLAEPGFGFELPDLADPDLRRHSLAYVSADDIDPCGDPGLDRGEVAEAYGLAIEVIEKAGGKLRRTRLIDDSEDDELRVLVHEFAPAFDAYLARPTAVEHPIATMADLARWNRDHAAEALKYGQHWVDAALAVDHREAADEYRSIRQKDLDHTSGALDEALGDADVLICPGIAGATWAARSGRPCVALPAGYGHRSRRPVGVTVVGRPGADAALLVVAAALEGVLPPRQDPWEINPAVFRGR